MMRNAFYFTLKSLFVFVMTFWSFSKKVNFKTLGDTTWLLNNILNTLPNISRSKGNQTMKIGQLIQYNRKNVVENHTQNVPEKLFRDPYPNKSKFSLSVDQQCKVLNSLFVLYANLRAVEIIIKSSCRPLAFT